MPEPGIKYDQAKPRYDLLPFESVDQIVQVLTFGAQKYSPDNWRHVPDGMDRYFAACLRHLSAWRQGERLDPDSGLGHLAHAACCILFMLSFEQGTAMGSGPEQAKAAAERALGRV